MKLNIFLCLILLDLSILVNRTGSMFTFKSSRLLEVCNIKWKMFLNYIHMVYPNDLTQIAGLAINGVELLLIGPFFITRGGN